MREPARHDQLAVYEAPEESLSTARLLSGIVGDIQDLVRKEIALAREETREELSKLKTATVAMATGGGVLAIGGMFLLVALCLGLATLLGWPAWTGFAILGGVLSGTGVFLVLMAVRRFQNFNPIPEKTVETVKENVEWLKERATSRT